MKLCSDIDEDVTSVVCDLPLGHRGPHQATIVWGDEGDVESDIGGEG